MGSYLNSKYDSLDAYTPGEQPKDTVYTKLNTNESPYPPGPKTIAAVSDPELIKRLRLYSDPDSVKLKEAIASNYGVERENVFVSNGSDDILNFAFMGFTERGVVFPEISYGFYEVFARLHGCEYKMVPLREDFVIDASDYAKERGMIVIANPNAPTGRTISLGDISMLAESDPERVVLIDEAYVDFGAESASGLTGKYDNLLVVHTYSKSRSLAGARLGFAIGSKAIIADLEKIKYSTNPYNVNSLTAAAGIAAMEEQDYYLENCRKIAETREWTVKGFKALGFKVVPSLANFIFVTSDKVDGTEYYEKLKARKILVRHFDKEPIVQYNRITVGTREDMQKLLDATQEILNEK